MITHVWEELYPTHNKCNFVFPDCLNECSWVQIYQGKQKLYFVIALLCALESHIDKMYSLL